MARGSPDPTMERLDSQIEWYDHRSASNKALYESLKAVELIAAAGVPVSALVFDARWPAATLGAIVVVLEGILQLKQFHANWIGYRSTCESLRHEKYLYLGRAGPYGGSNDPHTLLAERVEEIVSREHAKWVDSRSREVSQNRQGE